MPQNEGESAAWRGTLARVAEGVVAIEIDQTRAFDTEWNSSAQATGFVVDAERGLILTNRHVVTPGPVTSEALDANTAFYRQVLQGAKADDREGYGHDQDEGPLPDDEGGKAWQHRLLPLRHFGSQQQGAANDHDFTGPYR